MVASEKTNWAAAGASTVLDQSSEEEMTLLDQGPCQRNSVIRYLVPLALVACAATGISLLVLFKPSTPVPATTTTATTTAATTAPATTAATTTAVATTEDGFVEYFSEGMDKLGVVFDDLTQQVNAIKAEIQQAQASMKEWTDQEVAANRQMVLDCAVGLSDAADELENAESDLVGLCDSVAELLAELGEELKKKMASAESKRTQQDITDEQELMKSTMDFAANHLKEIGGRFDAAKDKFRKLAVTSAKQLRSKSSAETKRNDCREQFEQLEGKCDKLVKKVDADSKGLVNAKSPHGVLIRVNIIDIWKSQVLTKNKIIVKQLKDTVRRHHQSAV